MKHIRYEIFLPRCYNDGRPIERRKFRQSNLELVDRFLGTTVDVITALGTWKYRGTVYEDKLVRLIIDVPASDPADDFFRSYKETLKDRFEQIDIWISSHEIQVL
jgi:hypothetical protein